MNTRETAPAGKRMFRDSLVVGIDFGAKSGDAGLFRVSDGKLVASTLVSYPDDVITAKLPGGPQTASTRVRGWRGRLVGAQSRAVRIVGYGSFRATTA